MSKYINKNIDITPFSDNDSLLNLVYDELVPYFGAIECRFVDEFYQDFVIDGAIESIKFLVTDYEDMESPTRYTEYKEKYLSIGYIYSYIDGKKIILEIDEGGLTADMMNKLLYHQISSSDIKDSYKFRFLNKLQKIENKRVISITKIYQKFQNINEIELS